MVLSKKFRIRNKLDLSLILEKIEVNRTKLDVVKILDNYHSQSNGHVIGITGPPGVGKSSLINKLIISLRTLDLSVGVIAIDPSSMKSGGALLGDRARFNIDPKDQKIFVRSMAAKDYLGGISALTFPSMIIMRSIFDIVIIETVGVGQSEVSIEEVVDTVIYCVQPGSGDTLQFMKSGIIEIPDIIAVTKSDIENLANMTLSDLLSSKSYFVSNTGWEIKILSLSAYKEFGFSELKKLIDDRWLWLKRNNILSNQRSNQDLKWIKNSLISEYGFTGYKLLEEKINYIEKPFKYLNDLKKKIHLTIKN